MGGIIAMEILRRAPDRITRIALMGTNPLAETPPAAAEREPQIVGVRTGRLEQVMRKKLETQHFAPGPQRNDVCELVVDMALTLGGETFVRQSRALQRRRDQQGTLRKCKVPTLVLCGAHDQICPVKRHTFMAELIPFAHLVVLENAGHFMTLDDPAATTAALREWMSQPLVLR
jgi:pimeloyl-ACP methyl ester carboxylesterase